MAVLVLLAALALFATAAVQGADAAGRIRVRSYPFVNSDQVGLKWAYMVILILGGWSPWSTDLHGRKPRRRAQ